MQTVWSRVIQARCMCNCPSCLSNIGGLTRRATTATARRRVRFGNTFTVLSSSLAAAATLADSKRKEARSREWEKAISKTKAEIEAKETDQKRRLSVLIYTEEGQSNRHSQDDLAGGSDPLLKSKPIRKTRDSYGPSPKTSASELQRDSWGDVFDWAARQDEARAAAGFQDWRGPPLSLLQKLSEDQLQELLMDNRLFRRFYSGQDSLDTMTDNSKSMWSAKKLRTLEWSIAKLVYQLLLHCSEHPVFSDDGNVTSPPLSGEESSGWTSLGSVGAPINDKCKESHNNAIRITATRLACGLERQRDTSRPQNAAKISSRISQANSCLDTLHLDRRDGGFYKDFESPKLPIYRNSSSHVCGKIGESNRGLSDLLHGMEREKDSSPLMTKVCYNLLTSRDPPNINTYNLLLIRFCQLKNKELVRAVLVSMRESHIRPNEITHSTILRFFTTTNDAPGFKEYLNRMNGYNGGLALTKVNSQALPIVLDTVRAFGRAGAKFAEKAQMNAEVYVSLIIGALKFLGSQTAMFYYRRMISEGWKADTEILTAILRHCCYRSDWNAGLLVWEQIMTLGQRVSTLSYQWMLRLCQICGQERLFDQLLQDGVERGALPVSMLQTPDEVRSQNITSILEYAENIQRHNVRRLVPLQTRQWIRDLCSKNSGYDLDSVYQACAKEAAVRAMVERLKAKAKKLRQPEPPTSQILERRLESLVKNIEEVAANATNTSTSNTRLAVKIKMQGEQSSDSSRSEARVASTYDQEIKPDLTNEKRGKSAVRTEETKSSEVYRPNNDSVAVEPRQGHNEITTRQLLPMIPRNFPRSLDLRNPSPWEQGETSLAAAA